MESIYLIVAAMAGIATIISVIVATLSSIITFRYARKANTLKEENNRILSSEGILGWNDIERYVSVLFRKISNDKFLPDLVFCLTSRSAMVASLLCFYLYEFGNDKPTFVGLHVCTKEEEYRREKYDTKVLVRNSKNKPGSNDCLLFPTNLPLKKSSKILIVTDHSNSGIGFSATTDYFVEKYGIKRKNIKTACITYSAHSRVVPPNYFCRVADNIYFPWGGTL